MVEGLSQAPRAIRPGDRLGRYEIGEELGEGGMATVFRARDRELRREVAVKVLFPHLARRAEVVRRFHREARAAAGLEHPNILRIYDVGGGEPSADPRAVGELDPPYIVMELIRGRTLLQEIEQRGPLLAEVVACIGALLADALAAAHAAGIIHRDIKPSNVLVAQGGRLLLADFGVARLETEDSLVTRTGALLGTPAYMSPEQACGDTATARSDLYSLGATLYQLSTGVLPYGGSPAKVMSQLVSGQRVAPVRRRAAVGPELSGAIEAMMEADAAARPTSAAVVAGELRRIAAAGGLGDPADELAAFFEDAGAFLRARIAGVVRAIAAAAEQAIAERKLPRAIALADRGAALAPDDPAIAALVAKVTEGGRAGDRRRVIALAGGGVALAGGAIAVAMALLGGAGGTAGDPSHGGSGTGDGGALALDPRIAGDGGAGSARDPSGDGSASPVGALGPGHEDASEIGAGGDSDGAALARDPSLARVVGDAGSPVAATPDAARIAQLDADARIAKRGPSAQVAGLDPGAQTAGRDPGARVAGRDPGVQSAGRDPGSQAAGRDPGSRIAEPDPGSRAAMPDAGVRVVAPDARLAGLADAGAPPTPSIDTPPHAGDAPATLTVANDVWCNLSIDGVAHGRVTQRRTVQLAPGRHTVACEQGAGTGLRWSEAVELAA
ncbi:MAG: protein kinase domain-containing protein, partial [Kofleriaceae bacterium]